MKSSRRDETARSWFRASHLSPADAEASTCSSAYPSIPLIPSRPRESEETAVHSNGEVPNKAHFDLKQQKKRQVIFMCLPDLQFLFTSYTSYLKYATSAASGSCLLVCLERTYWNALKHVHFILDGTGMFIKERFWTLLCNLGVDYSFPLFRKLCVCKARIQVNGRSHWHWILFLGPLTLSNSCLNNIVWSFWNPPGFSVMLYLHWWLNSAANMWLCLTEINNKNIFGTFNVMDLPILQGYQGTGTSTVRLYSCVWNCAVTVQAEPSVVHSAKFLHNGNISHVTDKAP